MGNRLKSRMLIFFILISILISYSYSLTAVFPFKVSLKEERSLQWLGKALSLYIKCGFKLNNIATFRNEETDYIMKSYNIKFPYNVSKALFIKIASDMGADHLIWGEISTSGSPDKEKAGETFIKSFTIDLNNLTQKYFPVIKGDPKNIFKMEQNLFSFISKSYMSKNPILFPDIEFNKSSYEIYVKAMLLTDYSERIELLQKITRNNERESDLLNFELAKSYFFTNSGDKAEIYLSKIGENSYLNSEKFFLKGILDYFAGRTDKSMENFGKVLLRSQFKFETLNNYGVLLGIMHKYSESIKYLKESLEIKKSEEAFVNSIFILTLNKNEKEAKQTAISALIEFPYSEDLKNILKKFLKDFPLGKEVSLTLSKYIPGFNMENGDSKINFKLINPFIPNIRNNNSVDIGSEYNGANENSDPLINKTKKELWNSPFSSDLYFRLSKMLKKNRQYYSALDNAACALFLNGSKKNYINVINLLKKLGREKEMKIILNMASSDFPDSNDLISY